MQGRHCDFFAARLLLDQYGDLGEEPDTGAVNADDLINEH